MITEKFQLNEEAYMETYMLEDPLTADGWNKEARKRPVVVICPGGGYEMLSAREAEPIATAFNNAGMHAVVVYYRLRAIFPKSLKDVSDAVCIIRDNADKWHVDEDKVVVCGFSAGGHLAASFGVFWNSENGIKREDEKNKPNGMILGYPVITSGEKSHSGSIKRITKGDETLKERVSLENQVNSDTPPAFIWHTFEDELVPVENSLYMASALCEHNISTELHIFPHGPHGLALVNEFLGVNEKAIREGLDIWLNMAVRWIYNL